MHYAIMPFVFLKPPWIKREQKLTVGRFNDSSRLSTTVHSTHYFTIVETTSINIKIQIIIHYYYNYPFTYYYYIQPNIIYCFLF